MVLAFPCSPWCRLRTLGAGRPDIRERLEAERDCHRALLKFTAKVARWAHNRGKVVIVENPAGSDAWKQPELDYITKNFQRTYLDM